MSKFSKDSNEDLLMNQTMELPKLTESTKKLGMGGLSRNQAGAASQKNMMYQTLNVDKNKSLLAETSPAQKKGLKKDTGATSARKIGGVSRLGLGTVKKGTDGVA